MKQVSFTLNFTKDGKSQAETYRELAGSTNNQGKILRYYFFYNYHLPEDLTLVMNDTEYNKERTQPEKFVFDDECHAKLNELVTAVREKGYKVNRSSIMRHVFDELINILRTNPSYFDELGELNYKTIRFYFEDGTKDLLDELIPFRNRQAILERYILDEYVLTDEKHRLLEVPAQVEQINLKLNKSVYQKLDQHLDTIGTEGVTRTSIMRDVVYSLIKKLSDTDVRMTILNRRLERLLKELIEREGLEVCKEKVQAILKPYE